MRIAAAYLCALARVVSTFSGRRYAAFETVEQAKEWLVRQQA